MLVVKHLNRSILLKQHQTALVVQSCFFHKSTSVESKNGFLIDSPEYAFLKDIGIERENCGVYNGSWKGSGEVLTCIDPGTGRKIANVNVGTPEEMNEAIKVGVNAYQQWCQVPAPVRGDVIRQIGEEMRKYKEPLGKLVSLEVGKIFSEGQGEVQEFIDICDYAAGLSRIYSGQVINSERPEHTILEAWRPLGLVGIISAYNFPNAVFGWNAAIALVNLNIYFSLKYNFNTYVTYNTQTIYICNTFISSETIIFTLVLFVFMQTTGNSVLWKGAPTTSLVSVATMKILSEVLKRNNLPPIALLCQGGAYVGQKLVSDSRVKLVSFTGSCETGRNVGVEVQKRFGKVILELGGNNALIVDQGANFKMVLEAALFGCIGTSGQRCTTTRRIIVHEKLYDRLVKELVAKYKQVRFFFYKFRHFKTGKVCSNYMKNYLQFSAYLPIYTLLSILLTELKYVLTFQYVSGSAKGRSSVRSQYTGWSRAFSTKY